MFGYFGVGQMKYYKICNSNSNNLVCTNNTYGRNHDNITKKCDWDIVL